MHLHVVSIPCLVKCVFEPTKYSSTCFVYTKAEHFSLDRTLECQYNKITDRTAGHLLLSTNHSEGFLHLLSAENTSISLLS